MPIPRHQLEFLIGALQSQTLDPQQGVDMFLGFQNQAREKRMAQMPSGEGLDALRSAATDLTSGDTPIDPEAYVTRLQGVSQLYGMEGIPPDFQEALNSLYASQQVVFDDDDKKEIAGRALMSKNDMTFEDFQNSVEAEYMQQLGSLYTQIAPQVQSWIQLAWEQQVPPEYYS